MESWEDLSKLEKLVSTGTASVLDGDGEISETHCLAGNPSWRYAQEALERIVSVRRASLVSSFSAVTAGFFQPIS